MTEIVAPERITIVSNNSSSYAAIYVDGKRETFGDFDEVLERALDLAGIDLRYDDGFTRSGNRGDIAPTLDAIDEWNAGADERERVRLEAEAAARRAEEQAAADAAARTRTSTAAEKRAAAQALLAEADAIEAQG